MARATRIFTLALAAFVMQGMLYTAHRGLDLFELIKLAPLLAVVTTFVWMKKFPK
jgi:hypothetical protein